MVMRWLLFLGVACSAASLPGLAAVDAWDHGVTAWLVGLRQDRFWRIFSFISHLGGTLSFLLALAAAGLFYAWQRRYKTAVLYLVGVGFLRMSLSVLKGFIARSRPFSANLSTFSMPSGHAASAVLVFGVLGVFCLQWLSKPWLRGLAFGFCTALILLIDFSRLYLGVHFLSDVLMGSLYAAAGLWLLQGYHPELLRFGTKMRPEGLV